MTTEMWCCVQATNMALRQVGVEEAVCDALTADLNAWLEHIITSKVPACLCVKCSYNLVSGGSD